MTISDINSYYNKCGARAAADLLILIGPDAFEGDYQLTLDRLEVEAATMRRWYVITYVAEEIGTKIVDLTDSEADGLRRVCAAEYFSVSGGGYCGGYGISQPFPTYADARASIID